ncbi:MAG: tRNA-guanine transglycosylase, partial [Ignavibacteriae bacterium]|nr:tRNA-guanine transglycosylase [Ignavibacteriota bacterium]
MDYITTNHGKIKIPAFMPDATYGSIRTASFKDVESAGTEAIVTTTLHIEQKIGSDFIKKYGGIHKFFGWDKPILTDSGGWQVFSLINAKKD